LFPEAVNIYGNNVVTTEGDEWKRHRKIVGPPFNEKNNGYAIIYVGIKHILTMIIDWYGRRQFVLHS